MINKYLFVTGGLLASASLSLSAVLYSPLETGMKEEQILNALRSKSDLFDGPPSNALLSRTGINDVFMVKTPIGGQIYLLNFGFDSRESLKSVSLYSRKKWKSPEFDTRLKSSYKSLLSALTERYGEPDNVPDWPESEQIADGRIHYMHLWKISPDLSVLAGIGNMSPQGFFLDVMYTKPMGTLKSTKRDKEEVLREWAEIPEFPDLKDADLQIGDALKYMSGKKNKDAFECFRQASELGSPRGYWGMAFLAEQGKYGVKRDKELAMEMHGKAAVQGFVSSAMKFGKTWQEACAKLKISGEDAKALVKRSFRAAKEGYASEQYNLGMMYLMGFGVTKDPEKAKEWLEKAADQNDIQAKSVLKKFPS